MSPDSSGSSQARPYSGPGAANRSPDQIRADIERTRGDLSESVELLRGRVAELTDWRRQIAEHREQLIAGAAIAGFAVGALLVARRLRRG